jgi:hypothetical protein
VNHLLIEALERYGHFHGDALEVECPTGSGRRMTLAAASRELSRRLASLFLPDANGRRPFQGEATRFPDEIVFNEYFHGDDGRGVGARFQGWTSLVARCLEKLA